VFRILFWLAPFLISPFTHAQPLDDIRILVQKHSKNENRDLRIHGQALMDASGSPLPETEVLCRKEIAIASPLLNLDPSALLNPASSASKNSILRWTCRSGSKKWSLAQSSFLRDRSGFLQIENRWYRGSLEIVDRKHELWVINHVPLDEYIASVLHGEMPAYYELEALKAQAVAARSYAVATALERRRTGALFDLLDNPRDQVYLGAHKETDKGIRATHETKNEYLYLNGKILKAFYHASSGGHSEDPVEVWGPSSSEHSYAAYLARPNRYDKETYTWKLSLSETLFERIRHIGKLVDVKIHSRTRGHRVKELKFIGSSHEEILSIQNFRQMIRPLTLKNNKFEIKKEGRLWHLKGEGWGHGVGLSQVAAQKMAQEGKSYLEILRHHYPLASFAPEATPSPVKSQIAPRAR
jgi:stage II sporulation protein D